MIQEDADADEGHRTGPGSGRSMRFTERLTTPLWWYPPALGIAAILAAEFHVADRSLTNWLPFVLLMPASLVMIWSLGRQQVMVSDDELLLPDAHLPLSVVTAAVALDPTTLRRAIGRYGDPAAFLSTRPWIGPGVQIMIDDPDDPTPYWIVSTRRPDELVTALTTPG